MTQTSPQSSPYLAEVVRRLVAEFSPEKVVLFGSWAKGEARYDSDLDILVVARISGPLYRRMGRAHRALQGLPVGIDVFVCTPEEVQRYGRWLGHTVAIALREGRVVHESRA